MGLRLMTKHDSCDKLKKKLEVVQYGCGFPGGPEVMAHLARAMTERGFALNTQDAIKAFYTMSRQALLEAINTMWPEANAQFAAYYGPPAPCIFPYKDDEGNQVMKIQ